MSNLFFISGTHGSGKTTLINELKKDTRLSDKYTIFDSYTRSVYSKEPLARQIAIIASGISNYRQINNTIYNRSLVDTLAYTQYLVKNKEIPAYVNELNEKLLSEVKYLITHTFVTVPDFPLVGDEVRSSDEDFQKEIHNNVLQILEDSNIPYTLLEGSVEDRVKDINSVLTIYDGIEHANKQDDAYLVEDIILKLTDDKLKTFCLESFLRGLKYPETQTAFIVEEGVTKAFIKYRVEGDTLILSSIAALESGKGYGTKLFKFIKDKAHRLGSIQYFKVFVDKDAADFYRKLGVDLSNFEYLENERGSGWNVKIRVKC